MVVLKTRSHSVRMYPKDEVMILYFFVNCSEFLSLTSHTHAQYYAFTLANRNTQQGSARKGGSCVGPKVDLPLHCYLLLGHKGAPWRAASGRKASLRMSQLQLHIEEDPRIFPHDHSVIYEYYLRHGKYFL